MKNEQDIIITNQKSLSDRYRLCVDVVHELLGDEFVKYNSFGDLIVVVMVLLLVISLPYSNIDLVGRVVGLFFCVMVLRECLSVITFIESNVCKKKRPYLGGDQRTYLLSGHLIFSMMAAYIVCRSTLHEPLKFVAIFCALMIFPIQIITREHFAVDMLLTVVFVFMTMKAYCL